MLLHVILLQGNLCDDAKYFLNMEKYFPEH